MDQVIEKPASAELTPEEATAMVVPYGPQPMAWALPRMLVGNPAHARWRAFATHRDGDQVYGIAFINPETGQIATRRRFDSGWTPRLSEDDLLDVTYRVSVQVSR